METAIEDRGLSPTAEFLVECADKAGINYAPMAMQLLSPFVDQIIDGVVHEVLITVTEDRKPTNAKAVKRRVFAKLRKKLGMFSGE